MQITEKGFPDVAVAENTIDIGPNSIYDLLRVIRRSRTFFIRRKSSPVRGQFMWYFAPRNYDEHPKLKFPKKPSKNWR